MKLVRSHYLLVVVLLAGCFVPFTRSRGWAYDVVLSAQNEYLDAYLIDGSEPPKRVAFIDPDPPDPSDRHSKARIGRHVNGQVCFFPKGFGPKGGFVIADDTYREACLDRHPAQARCSVYRKTNPRYVGRDPDGWGVFRRNGKWAKRVIHVDVEGIFSDANQPQGTIDPQGCAFDSHGNFYGVDVGHGAAKDPDGAFVVFFPGKHKRYDTYCFLDKSLKAAGMPVMDDAGNFYIPEPAALRVTKFSPPFPTSAADCANPEHLVTTPPTKTVFAPGSGLLSPAGIARVPHSDHFYIGSVVIPPIINEYDESGTFVRNIVPLGAPRNPLGIDAGSDGTVYYSELNLDPVTFDTRCGSVSRVGFDALGQPQPPEQIGRHLNFPDGITVVDSSRLRVKWDKLPPSPDLDPTRCGGE